MADRKAQLFVVSAPSGAGKTSLLRRLVARTESLQVSVSHTTRAMRTGEREGKDYFFVDVAAFEAMVARGEFVEHARVFGNLYGTSLLTINQALAGDSDLVLEIDWQGARLIRDLYPAAITVFILPPSLEELRKRLELRGEDDPEVIDRRMQAACAEISHYPEYDYLVVNEDFDQASADLAAIVRACRLRTHLSRWAPSPPP